ncbi:tetraacyldisaccharide 4'-kinase [Roseospira marina]|uniref:Tetraacyldisaccharide 4'-kinase n=1 Tax=Roseospira marina TaxID=140057 RepID=A0A5M6IDT1_9PROT|nr:tetraacyldisaccharide 4'-kinase [Roseospira marina]KAA5606426.1 tetraacyldisaccharide 4'-kinase [Roseospira marina]MBB4314160.1 tetraacyldisaccharide 4'-kinase [Roseospira marina]MBB5087321.1 tetraacyldisaccharide 4'-kinase [Roseospira marina]
MRAPEFWWRRDGGGLPGRLLEPAGLLYGWATARRLARGQPARLPVPVICVGNLVAGGAGKTPVVLDIITRLRRDLGLNAVVLSRGHGGREAGPLRVDPGLHTAADVGDEPLMMARAGLPVWIARDRADGGRAAVAEGAGAVVMDDGFQNPALVQDLPLVVVDGARGFGNGRLVPAGPLREPVPVGLARAGAVVVMGEDTARVARHVPRGVPVLAARIEPGPRVRSWDGQRVVAFAGIGDPDKVFRLLRDVGCRVVATHPFADHHPYQPTDIQPILDEAFALGALPVTTAKDAARLTPDQRQQVDIIDVTVTWSDPVALDRLLGALAARPPKGHPSE